MSLKVQRPLTEVPQAYELLTKMVLNKRPTGQFRKSTILVVADELSNLSNYGTFNIKHEKIKKQRKCYVSIILFTRQTSEY